MTKSTWTGAVSSDWDDADNWSPAGVPGVDSDVVIASGAAVASASIGTVNSITDSSDLSFESAGTNTVATTLDNTGRLYVASVVPPDLCARSGRGAGCAHLAGFLPTDRFKLYRLARGWSRAGRPLLRLLPLSRNRSSTAGRPI